MISKTVSYKCYLNSKLETCSNDFKNEFNMWYMFKTWVKTFLYSISSVQVWEKHLSSKLIPIIDRINSYNFQFWVSAVSIPLWNNAQLLSKWKGLRWQWKFKEFSMWLASGGPRFPATENRVAGLIPLLLPGQWPFIGPFHFCVRQTPRGKRTRNACETH